MKRAITEPAGEAPRPERVHYWSWDKPERETQTIASTVIAMVSKVSAGTAISCHWEVTLDLEEIGTFVGSA